MAGRPAITAVVDDFVKNVAADKRINRSSPTPISTGFKARLVEQICQGTGGPCTYSGRDMRSAHAGMGIQGKHFNALVEDLGKTLSKLKVRHASRRNWLRSRADEAGHRHALIASSE